MRVLFVVSNANKRGGTEILAFNLLHELNRKGYDCFLLSRFLYEGEDDRVISFTKSEFQKWQSLNNNPLNKISGSVLSDSFFRKLVAKYANALEVDWVINHTYDLIAAIPNDKSFNTAQIFNWSINGYEDTLMQNSSQKSFISRQISHFSFYNLTRRWHLKLSSYTRLVVLTDTAHHEIQALNPQVIGNRIVTIPDPINYTEDALNVSTLNNNNIVYVGRLSHEKGVMRLLRIWEKVSLHLPHCSLSIYGEGSAREEMENYVSLHCLQRVKFMGFCVDLKLIYTHADLLLMTSDTEGFGMVLIEAMYYGVPCISFDCPISPKEIIADAGVTIPAFDEEAYADQVVELLGNYGQLLNFQKAAIKRARCFYINKVLNKWMELLNFQNL